MIKASTDMKPYRGEIMEPEAFEKFRHITTDFIGQYAHWSHLTVTDDIIQVMRSVASLANHQLRLTIPANFSHTHARWLNADMPPPWKMQQNYVPKFLSMPTDHHPILVKRLRVLPRLPCVSVTGRLSVSGLMMLSDRYSRSAAVPLRRSGSRRSILRR